MSEPQQLRATNVVEELADYLEGFGVAGIMDFIRSLDETSQKAYTRTMTLYVAECQLEGLDPTSPLSVKEFAKLRHEDGLKTSTIRSEVSKIASMFIFGLQKEVYKECPTIQRELAQWEKSDTTKKSEVFNYHNITSNSLNLLHCLDIFKC
jgi:site-specific recombinase XerD